MVQHFEALLLQQRQEHDEELRAVKSQLAAQAGRVDGVEQAAQQEKARVNAVLRRHEEEAEEAQRQRDVHGAWLSKQERDQKEQDLQRLAAAHGETRQALGEGLQQGLQQVHGIVQHVHGAAQQGLQQQAEELKLVKKVGEPPNR